MFVCVCEERLKYLKLPTLKATRIRGDLIQTYKMFNNIYNVDKACFLDSPLINITRNSTDKILMQHCKKNIRKYYFSNRVVPLWNQLTPNMKRAPSINMFKNLIEEYLLRNNIIYDHDGQ